MVSSAQRAQRCGNTNSDDPKLILAPVLVEICCGLHTHEPTRALELRPYLWLPLDFSGEATAKLLGPH